jgi:hypothetical protein
MAKKYTCPPQSATGAGTFSDDLVGFQLVQGGGLTQGNFEFTQAIVEKTNRNFEVGTFSSPITLDTLQIDSIEESKRIVAKNYQVYPNFDLTDVTNFTLYGSLTKRISTSVQKIINFFPASFESNLFRPNFGSGETAYNITYDQIVDETTFDIDVVNLFNPFSVDYSENAFNNLQAREISVSGLRNFTSEYLKYILKTTGGTYDVVFIVPSSGLTGGVLNITIKGNPFSGQSIVYENLQFRPNDYEVEVVFQDQFDEVEKFLTNRLISPPYTAIFQVPQENEQGLFYTQKKSVTWPLDGSWNLDIRSVLFSNYLETLSQITTQVDEYKTNLISRFLTTGSLKDFDTVDQKAEKMFQIYGRSFDETKKFIDALAFMNSVNYTIHNDIPSQLLKNLAQTLGWKTNISPISEEDFLSSVFGNTSEVEFPGYSKPLTPNELNYQYYRNLILNSAFLFKSKGTRKSVESLMRLIGAPEALVEFNENVYLADQVINMNRFENFFAAISGGTYAKQSPTLNPAVTYSIRGVVYTGYTSVYSYQSVNLTIDDYPVDDNGYPMAPEDNEDYFFQKGAGWFEVTTQHRSPEYIDQTASVFTGSNPSVQTGLEPFTYGQKYLDRYRIFPYMEEGFKLIRVPDNRKSWTIRDNGLRRYSDGGFNSYYYNYDDRLVLNVKNVDLFLNPAQGLAYDVWSMSNKYDYPIPQSGMSAPYPTPGLIDWTTVNPQPKKLTFFEFAQTFWRNLINVRDRQFNTDGKTSGYPTLQSIWWLYLNSGSAINVPNDNFNYQTMIKYVEGLGDYWIRLVEQMIPATTIWNGGYKYENSIFHRQKFVWKRQAGCQVVFIPCVPCELTAPLFTQDCQTQFVNCSSLYPWQVNSAVQNFEILLTNTITNYLATQSLTLNDCVAGTVTSNWYLDLYSGNTGGTQVQISHYKFFQGFGLGYPGSSSPDPQSDYITGINNAFFLLYSYGLYYYIDSINNKIIFFTIDCSADDPTDTLTFNISIDFNIGCN